MAKVSESLRTPRGAGILSAFLIFLGYIVLGTLFFPDALHAYTSPGKIVRGTLDVLFACFAWVVTAYYPFQREDAHGKSSPAPDQLKVIENALSTQGFPDLKVKLDGKATAVPQLYPSIQGGFLVLTPRTLQTYSPVALHWLVRLQTIHIRRLALGLSLAWLPLNRFIPFDNVDWPREWTSLVAFYVVFCLLTLGIGWRYTRWLEGRLVQTPAEMAAAKEAISATIAELDGSSEFNDRRTVKQLRQLAKRIGVEIEPGYHVPPDLIDPKTLPAAVTPSAPC